MLSKILPGSAAEQAGKLGEGTTNKSLNNSTKGNYKDMQNDYKDTKSDCKDT